MAISATHLAVIRILADAQELPQGGSILEIGEANWYYNDAPGLDDEIRNRTNGAKQDEMLARLAALLADKPPYWNFSLVKLLYEVYWAPEQVDSIDFDGTPQAAKLDLNEKIPIVPYYDTVINHGTAEHVFNIGQVFRTIHDATAFGGLMIHESPFTGWIEHGFYSLQPGLFFDLAETNDYRMVAMYIQDLDARSLHGISSREEIYDLAKDGKLPANSMLLTVLRKTTDLAFRVPIQGVYRAALSPAGVEAWQTLR